MAKTATMSIPKKPRLEVERSTSKEDLFDAHDFDIEIDVGATLAPTPTSVGATSTSGGEGSHSRQLVSAKPSAPVQGNKGPKRSLKLSDYKKKRGLI